LSREIESNLLEKQVFANVIVAGEEFNKLFNIMRNHPEVLKDYEDEKD